MKYLILLVPLTIALTCRSTPVLGKTLDWTKWAVPNGPTFPTGVDIATTTLSPVVPEAPWLKWLKSPIADPSGSTGSLQGGASGSVPAVAPWVPWAKAKPIPAFIKPKIFPFTPASAPVQSLPGESSFLLGPQLPNPVIAQSPLLASQIPPATYNVPSYKILLESLGIPQQATPANYPSLPWNKVPTFPSISGNVGVAPVQPKAPAVPETFWTQLLKLTSPKVPKIPVEKTKATTDSEHKVALTPQIEIPEDASVIVAQPDAERVQPVPEISFSPEVLDQFLKSFPELSEALLKGETTPSLEPTENAEVIQPTDTPVIPFTENNKIPAVAVSPKNSSKEVPVDSPSTPQELFLQLLKLKGIPISNILESEAKSSAVAPTVPSSPNPKLTAESAPVQIPAASLEKLGLSEPVLSRLLQLLTPPVPTETNATQEIVDSVITKNTVATESSVSTITATNNITNPTPTKPEIIRPNLAPPTNPATLWTEWLKLKTPKIPEPITTPAAPLLPLSPTETPEVPWIAWIKSQTPIEPVSSALPPEILPTKTVPNPSLPAKIEAATHPTLPEEILLQLLKLKTAKIPESANTPVTSPTETSESPLLAWIKSQSPIPPANNALPIPAPAVVPPKRISVTSLPVKIPAPLPPVGVEGLPATPEEILIQLLKLKSSKIIEPAKVSTALPVLVPGTPEAPLLAWIKSQTPLPKVNNTLPPPAVPPSNTLLPVPSAPPTALPVGMEDHPDISELWTQWLKLKTPVAIAPQESKAVLGGVVIETKTEPELKSDLPIPLLGLQIPILPATKLNAAITASEGAMPNVIAPPVFAFPPALPITVDDITIPAEVWTQLLKIELPEETEPISAKPETEVASLTLPPGKEIPKPIHLSSLPVTVDGVSIPEELLHELLKLTKAPVQLTPPSPVAVSPVPAIPKVPQASWPITMETPAPPQPAISQPIVPGTGISPGIITGLPLPIIPAPVATTSISGPPEEPEWTPLSPAIPITTPGVPPVAIPAPASAAIPLYAETIWAQLLKLNGTEIVNSPAPVQNPVIEPPWIKWIKMNTPPSPTPPTESAVPQAKNSVVPQIPESEMLFASWLKPLATSEASITEGDTLVVPTPASKDSTKANVTEELHPAVEPTAPISEVSKVPIPVGLPETFWTELIKSYARPENKTEAPAKITERPVPVDPWTEWLQKLDTLISTPASEVIESVTEESTTATRLTSEEAVTKSPLHNLTCCEWLAKLLPPNVLNETLKKLQQTRSANSQNPRHHHSSEETSSSEEMKRAVGMPDFGVESPSTTKPKLDIVPPGFWAGPTTTETSALAAVVDPAFWAAKKAMFISNLFSALAKVAMNATAEPSPTVAQPDTAGQQKNLSASSPVLAMTNNKARSASSDSDEESSESHLRKKSKKKSSPDKKRPFPTNKQKSKHSKAITRPANKKSSSKSKIESKNKSHHSNHHNHHKHNHSVKKSSETTTAGGDSSSESPSTTTTTENPVDFSSLAKALLVQT